MEAETIYEVLTNLIGKIEPAGDAAIDGTREENMKVFIEVFDKMHCEIDRIAFDYKDNHEASIKRIVGLCDYQLDKMGIES